MLFWWDLSVDFEQNISNDSFLLIVDRIVGVGSDLKTIHIDQNIKRKAAGCHTELIFNEEKLK